MNSRNDIERKLAHYETLMYHYFTTDELPSTEMGHDPLEQYLHRVLSSPPIQEKLADGSLQLLFKQQMLHFFRYMLMLAEMSCGEMDEASLHSFEEHLTREMNRADHFLTSRQASASHFKEMLKLTAGRQWNEQDYIVVKDIKDSCWHHPALSEIVRRMGRTVGNGTESISMQEGGSGHSRRFLPSDIAGVATGDDIASALPTELVFLTSPLLETVFLNRWSEHRLQVFQHRSTLPTRATRRGIKERAGRGGAMIACVDTSGSMFGRKEQIAKGMVMELLETAKRQRRPLYLITFSIRIRCVEATRLPAGELYEGFLRTTFSGGTSCLAVLSKALEVLQTEHFLWADVLFISDFEFDKCTEKLLKAIAEAQQRGTAFYGLQLGKGFNPLHNLFNKIWQL